MAEVIHFKSKQHTNIGLESGRVLNEKAESLYEVLIENGPIWMKKCDSCLLKPEIGDEVIVAVLKKQAVILSILKAKNSERILDLGQVVTIKAVCLNLQSENYRLSSNYAMESIHYFKMIKSNFLLEEAKTIQVQTERFAVN